MAAFKRPASSFNCLITASNFMVTSSYSDWRSAFYLPCHVVRICPLLLPTGASRSKVTCVPPVAPTPSLGESRIFPISRALGGRLRYNPRMAVGSPINPCKVAEKLETQVTLKVLAAHTAAIAVGSEG